MFDRTPKMVENANKFAYLVQQYPEHNLDQLVALLQMPAIDINTAIWAAQDMSLVSPPDKQTKFVQFLVETPAWNFGEVEANLEIALMYAFGRLAAEETDLEEHYLSQWTAGYTSHDTLIALKRLIETKKLAQYAIEDGDSTYQFFTLFENKNELWGNKQFKKAPLEPKKKPKKK